MWNGWRPKEKKLAAVGFDLILSRCGLLTRHRQIRTAITHARVYFGPTCGRSHQIEMEDVGEMNELFLDAKTSASMIEGGGFMGE